MATSKQPAASTASFRRSAARGVGRMLRAAAFAAMGLPTSRVALRRTSRRARAVVLAAAAILFVHVTVADAQGRRAHLSNDLQQHLDAGDATATTVIVSGTYDQVA